MSRSKSRTHHVVPQNGGWAVKRGGALKSSGQYRTKAEAIREGRRISGNQGTEFVVHGRDGQIQSKDSHGNDPFPPRG